MKSPTSLLAVVTLCLLMGACREHPTSSELGPADIIGVVFFIDPTTPAATHPSRIWLDTLVFPEPRAHPPDRAGIVIWSDTDIFVRHADDMTEPGAFTDIHVGNRVQVWHGDFEYRSLPPQYDGIRVEILEDE